MKRRTKEKLAWFFISAVITAWLLIAMVGSVRAQEVMFIHPVADAHIMVGSGYNFGSEPDLYVRYKTGIPSYTIYGYLKYEIPEDLAVSGKYEISDVRLTMTVKFIDMDVESENVDMLVWTTSTDWSEDTITGTNNPAPVELVGEFSDLTDNLELYQKISTSLDNFTITSGFASFVLMVDDEDVGSFELAHLDFLSREAGTFGTIEFTYVRIYIVSPQLVALALIVTLAFAGFGLYRKMGEIHDLNSLIEGWVFLIYLAILVITAVVLAWSFIG